MDSFGPARPFFMRAGRIDVALIAGDGSLIARGLLSIHRLSKGTVVWHACHDSTFRDSVISGVDVSAVGASAG